jgi:hypothetical protein
MCGPHIKKLMQQIFIPMSWCCAYDRNPPHRTSCIVHAIVHRRCGGQMPTDTATKKEHYKKTWDTWSSIIHVYIL